MSVEQIQGAFYVVDEAHEQMDGPYVEQGDAERAAYELDHRLEVLEG